MKLGEGNVEKCTQDAADGKLKITFDRNDIPEPTEVLHRSRLYPRQKTEAI